MSRAGVEAEPAAGTPIAATGGPIVSAASLSFHYRSGRVGIESLDLMVGAGETVVLLGPNGSGKTTVIRLLAGDLRPTAGRLTMAAGRTRRERRSGIGYAQDNAAQLDELTGRENARLFARAFGADDGSADTLLDRFGLADDADVAVGEYSFGMRRKLALAQALAHRPTLLLLDEPTIGLDPSATATLHVLLRERAQAGAGVVIATNDVRVTVLADRVVFLHRGRAIAADSPAALLHSVQGATRIEVELEGGPSEAPDLPAGISSSPYSGGLVFTTADGPARLPAICQALTTAGARIRRVNVTEPGFDDVFRQLTGEALASPPTSDESGSGTAGHPGVSGTTGRTGERPAGRPAHRGPPWRRR